MVNQPLTSPQITALLAELAPAAQKQSFAQKKPITTSTVCACTATCRNFRTSRSPLPTGCNNLFRHHAAPQYRPVEDIHDTDYAHDIPVLAMCYYLSRMDRGRQKTMEISRRPVLLVGGKGGVGKTTSSGAIAAALAARGHRTLLITSDMTPSLSDILEQRIGDAVTAVGKNLDAYEMSQEAIMAWWRKRFGRDFNDILAHLIDIEALDKESQHQLLDYIGSAPSLREETMLDVIRDMAENRGYERIVWDTAPAGETLNLLDMPRNIRKHISAGARVFEGLDRIGKQLMGKRSIAAIMDDWTKASEEISRFIRDTSTFIIVANPEALVVKQARRMIATLTDYRLPIRGLIINRVVEQADSASLTALQDRQTGYIEELRAMAEGRHVAMVPLSLTEIRGRERLQEIGERLVAGLAL